MPSTTSLAKRRVICTLRFSTGGRPIFFRQALYCSGKTSLNGRARAKSSALSSWFSSSVTAKSDFLAIASYLSGISLTQRDDPHDLAPHREDEDVKPPLDQAVSLSANLAIRTAFIGNHRRRVEIHPPCGCQ